MPRCSPGARATTGRKDDPHATDGSGGGGGGARGRDAARGAVLRPEQSAVPELRLPDHPDRSLRGVLLSGRAGGRARRGPDGDRKSTRLNSSHSQISYAVFCLKKKPRTGPTSTDSPPIASPATTSE